MGEPRIAADIGKNSGVRAHKPAPSGKKGRGVNLAATAIGVRVRLVGISSSGRLGEKKGKGRMKREKISNEAAAK